MDCLIQPGGYNNTHLIPSNAIVRDVDKLETIYDFMRKIWDVKNLNPNPMALPVSLERKDFSVLNGSPYAVSEKSDGLRYMLVLGKYSDGTHYSVMLDRKFTVYEVNVAAKEEHFTKGTLVDGELVWEFYSSLYPPRQLYMVFDVLNTCGEDHQTMDYPLLYL